MASECCQTKVDRSISRRGTITLSYVGVREVSCEKIYTSTGCGYVKLLVENLINIGVLHLVPRVILTA